MASYTLSNDARMIRNETNTHEAMFYQVSSTCAAYELAMYHFDLPEVSPDLQMAVSELPLNFSMDAYVQLIIDFGTHYVDSLQVGARWGAQYTFETPQVQMLLDQFVNMEDGLKQLAKTTYGQKPDTTNDYWNVEKNVKATAMFSVGPTFNG